MYLLLALVIFQRAMLIFREVKLAWFFNVFSQPFSIFLFLTTKQHPLPPLAPVQFLKNHVLLPSSKGLSPEMWGWTSERWGWTFNGRNLTVGIFPPVLEAGGRNLLVSFVAAQPIAFVDYLLSTKQQDGFFKLDELMCCFCPLRFRSGLIWVIYFEDGLSSWKSKEQDFWTSTWWFQPKWEDSQNENLVPTGVHIK